MNAYEVAKQAKDNGARLFRERKGSPGQYDCKSFSGNRRGWTIIDSFSASAIVAVYDSLNERNRATFLNLGLEKMAAVAFKLIS